jgi:hypothetical protein
VKFSSSRLGDFLFLAPGPPAAEGRESGKRGAFSRRPDRRLFLLCMSQQTLPVRGGREALQLFCDDLAGCAGTKLKSAISLSFVFSSRSWRSSPSSFSPRPAYLFFQR